MLTAYDATMAALLDRAGIDVLLVGDSVGMVDARLRHHAAGDARRDAPPHALPSCAARERALVIADMPFMTYQVTRRRSGPQRRAAAAGRGRRRREARGRAAGARRRAPAGRGRHSGDGPPRPAAAVGAPAWRLPQARHRARTKPTRSSPTPRRFRTPARSRSCSSRCRPRWRARITGATRGADDRHRRRPALRRPGAGEPATCSGCSTSYVPSFVKQYANLAEAIVGRGSARTWTTCARAGFPKCAPAVARRRRVV